MHTKLCDLLGIKYPIILGGMAWVGTAELVSAVSAAGGLGLIGSGNAPASWVREQIRQTRQRTDKPFGVNVVLVSRFADEIIETVIEERVAVVATGAGNPGPLMDRFKEAGIKVIPVVASVALARRLERAGADAVVAEGMESGGHVGEVTTMALVPQVVDALSIPVIAAGGIADGRGLVAALALGAQGVQIGTRFICTTECIAHPKFKQKIIAARDRSTMTTGHTLRWAVRVLRNPMARRFAALEKDGISPAEIEEFGIGRLRLGAVEGDVENGSLMAGQIAGLVNDIRPARAIIEDMVAQAEAIIRGLPTLARDCTG